MAHHLFPTHLKSVAGKYLTNELGASNSLSTYYSAKNYNCEELVSETKSYILANFTAVAKTEGFLNLPSEEVKMWISSDEINVSHEEDVFKIILRWINRESERKKYFAELFREVRLVYISRDFLHNDIVTNDLVNDNEGCMDRVRDAIKFTASKDYYPISVAPRKSLETPVLVLCVEGFQGEQKLCYFPRKDTWSRFPGAAWPTSTGKVISCGGKMYFISQRESKMFLYDSFSDCWRSLPYEEQRTLHKLFVRNEDEVYALLSENGSCPECDLLRSLRMSMPCKKTHLSVITRYNPERNSWEDISSFDLGLRSGICVVAKDNFIYFLGGAASVSLHILKCAHRYDSSTNTWTRIADLEEPRMEPAYGSVAHGKIIIAGGTNADSMLAESCEMYYEKSDEWHLIRRPRRARSLFKPIWVCADGKLYEINGLGCVRNQEHCIIECYDPERDEWDEKTRMPIESMLPASERCGYFQIICCCSIRVFKGSKFLQPASLPCPWQARSSERVGKYKCVIV